MLRDSSTSNVAFAGDKASSQVLLQGGKETQIPGGENPYFVEVVQRFPTEILKQVSSLCAVCFRTLSRRRTTPSPRLEEGEIFSQEYFANFSVWQGICASTSSTLDDPQKVVANILPEIGVT